MTKTFSLTLAALTIAIIAFGGFAFAAGSITVGNPAISRANLDTFTNFTIIDTNSPVSANGTLDTFTYYADNTNPFEFVIVDAGNVVKYISPTITPASAGVQTFIATGGVPVSAGWNLGVHFDSSGTIPFDGGGSLATYTADNSGSPTVGVALVPAGTTNRTYSWIAGAGLIVDDDLACPGAAYTTIQGAVDAASSGDTVQVCPGTYVEAVNVTKPLTLESTTLNGAVIRPSNNVNPGIYINTVNNVTIDGFEIDGTVGLIQTGISGLNSNNVTLTNNVIHDIKDSPANNAGLGIVLYGWDQGIDNALIQGNTVSNTDHHGIWIGAVQSDGVTPILSNNNVIKGNTVHHAWQDPECGTIPEPCWGGAIGMDTAQNGSIEENSIHDTGGNQRDIMLINGFNNVSITDNILAHSDGAAAASVGWMQPAIEIATSDNSNLTVTSNSITTDIGSPSADGWVVYVPDVGGTSSFSNNTITLTGSAPPSFLHGLVPRDSLTGNWTVQDNTFEGGNLGTDSVGIRLYDTLPATSNINITGNQIHGWANGIRSNALANAALVTANRNSITGNSTNGVLDGGSVPDINATCNWWGNASGPSGIGPGSGDAVNGNVDFTTWLTTSNLAGDCNGPLPQVTVTMVKYIDDAHATAANANSAAFPMLETWVATNFSGTDVAFDLSPVGVNTTNEYEAVTAPPFDAGADFTMHEVTSEPEVGASCADGKPFALVGYSTGETLLEAEEAEPTLTEPNFTNLTSDKFVIVWNEDCTSHLTLEKVVVNDHGGTALDTEWTLSASGPTPISGSEGDSAVTNAVVTPGTYDLSESGGPADYTASDWVCSTGSGGGGGGGYGPLPNFVQDDADTVTIEAGEDVICTITNDDVPGTIIVEKVLINDDGGTKTATNFSFKVDGGVSQSFEFDAQNDVLVAAGSHTIVEDATAGYITTYSNSENANADCNNLSVAQGGSVTCTITNNDVPPPPSNACSLGAPPPGYTLVNGTAGNDAVTLAPYSMFKGNGGRDVVQSSANGNYIVCTLGGNDVIRLSGSGAVTIDAGNGRNSVNVGNMTGFITTGTGDDQIGAGNGARTISAGAGRNTITTGSGDQNITTGSGDDFISTNSGNDTINAGNGKNNVFSKGGNDSVTTGSGKDFIDAGPGSDTCSAGGGSNTVFNCTP